MKELYDLSSLREAWEAGERYEFLYFWGHRPPRKGGVSQACLSQWWSCDFQVEGQKYRCAEQYMMAEKARLFGDAEAERRIMEAAEPGEMKAWGRKVKNFDAEVWERECDRIVLVGNMAKFGQNAELWSYLAATEPRILVEASPVDFIWGIGLSQEAPDAADPRKWRGENRLGFVLTRVRDLLKQK